MQEAEHQRKDTSFDEFGSDGELSGAVFCTDCGSLNDVGAEVCQSCDAVLAEQGNHLAARLRRISRRASSAERQPSKSSDVIGSTWKEPTYYSNEITNTAIKNTNKKERSETSVYRIGSFLAYITFEFLSLGLQPSPKTQLKLANQEQKHNKSFPLL